MALKEPIDIPLDKFLNQFGFNPFEAAPPMPGNGGLGLDLQETPEAPPSRFDTQADPYLSGGADRAPQVAPPQAPGSFPTPMVGPNQTPDPYQEGGPPPVQEVGLQPGGMSKSAIRRLVQMETVRPLIELVQRQPEALGPYGQHLAGALQGGPDAFLSEYYGLLESDPQFQKQMVVFSQNLRERPRSEDFGGTQDLTPEKDLQHGVMARNDPERQDALRVGSTAGVDLSRMADLIDESTGKADGLNQKFRVDFVSMSGIARDQILKPLVDSGDLDGATKFDALLDAMEKDIVDLSAQGYHPNAIPIRIALQYRLELDKNPDLMEDSGFGSALRQMRGLFRQEIDEKVSRTAGLTQAVSPAEWRESMNAYDQAFEIAKKTEPPTYRRRP